MLRVNVIGKEFHPVHTTRLRVSYVGYVVHMTFGALLSFDLIVKRLEKAHIPFDRSEPLLNQENTQAVVKSQIRRLGPSKQKLVSSRL